MGNTQCCADNNQSKLQLGQIKITEQTTIGSIKQLTIMHILQNFMHENPNIYMFLTQYPELTQKFSQKHRALLKNGQQYVLQEGVFIGETIGNSSKVMKNCDYQKDVLVVNQHNKLNRYGNDKNMDKYQNSTSIIDNNSNNIEPNHKNSKIKIDSGEDNNKNYYKSDKIYGIMLYHTNKDINKSTNNINSSRLNINNNNNNSKLLNINHYYQGQWQDNNKCGMGILVSDTSCYYGQWKNDLAQGYGQYYSIYINKTNSNNMNSNSNNSDTSSNHHHDNNFYNKEINCELVYEGYWKQGMKMGRGMQKYQDGSVYTGEFVENRKHGIGTLVYCDGTKYEGQFKNDIIDGHGIYTGRTHTYEGGWLNGKMHGTGKSQWKDSKNKDITIAKYIGQYRNGIKQGFGEYTDSRGIVYKAFWSNGQIYEKGPLVTQNYSSVANSNRTISSNHRKKASQDF